MLVWKAFDYWFGSISLAGEDQVCIIVAWIWKPRRWFRDMIRCNVPLRGLAILSMLVGRERSLLDRWFFHRRPLLMHDYWAIQIPFCLTAIGHEMRELSEEASETCPIFMKSYLPLRPHWAFCRPIPRFKKSRNLLIKLESQRSWWEMRGADLMTACHGEW